MSGIFLFVLIFARTNFCTTDLKFDFARINFCAARIKHNFARINFRPMPFSRIYLSIFGVEQWKREAAFQLLKTFSKLLIFARINLRAHPCCA